jgi:UDPglucose 6-dehydrogenase
MRPELCFLGDTHLANIYRQAATARQFTVISDAYCADLVFLAQDVDSDDDVKKVSRLISMLQMHDDVPIIVLSQVPPGFTRSIPYIPVFYQAETLITTNGRSLDCALNPDRIIVGTFSGSEADIPTEYLQYLNCFTSNIIVMSYEAAELAKSAINVFLASSIRTANVLSEVAKTIGVRWDDIVKALRSDPRIGEHAYVMPGEFGPHLQRDWDRIKKMVRDDMTMMWW